MPVFKYIAKNNLWIMFWYACLITLVVGIATDQAHALVCLSISLSIAVIANKLIQKEIRN